MWRKVIHRGSLLLEQHTKYIEAASPEQAICRYCGVVHGGVEELYDLSKDLEENNNIVDIAQSIAEEMKRRLRELRKRIIVDARLWHLKKRLGKKFQLRKHHEE